MSTTAENIQRQISENPILIYMKGTPQLSMWNMGTKEPTTIEPDIPY